MVHLNPKSFLFEYKRRVGLSNITYQSIINNTIYPFCKKKTSCLNGKNSEKYTDHKLVILDEADSITPKAQNLLSNIISEFRKNTRTHGH